MRAISPPIDELGRLADPPSDAIVQVVRFFDERLAQPWEIYVRPYMNGLRPDVVLLHPAVGIAAFQVIDWEISAGRYVIEQQGEGEPPLIVDVVEHEVMAPNPIDMASTCQWEIFNLYCPRLGGQGSLAAITSGVVCTNATRDEAENLLRRSFRYFHMDAAPRYHPISGCDDLVTGDVLAVFPEANRRWSKHMNAERARDLRGWLIEPDFAKEARSRLGLDEAQERYVTRRPSSANGYRRVRGPAGSGKSLVLAARAAQLALEGKEVLVISYNLTLLHYLRDLADRWPVAGSGAANRITWMNFHLWCRRVCKMTGWGWAYDRLWPRVFGGDDDSVDPDDAQDQDALNEVLQVDMPELVLEVLSSSAPRVKMYDAILVDEGQDILPAWWDVLRRVCRPGGEMHFAADLTQDIYENAELWTERTMREAGFPASWFELKTSYRLPPRLAELVCGFADRFLPEADPPRETQLRLETAPCELRWVQTSSDEAVQGCAEAVLDFMRAEREEALAFADIVLLVPDQAFGTQVLDVLRRHRIVACHTFARNRRDSRRLKLVFFLSDARIKATSIHSFKGWEATAMVLYAGDQYAEDRLRLIYTGLTRLRATDSGSLVTVVSAVPQLASYGKTWPTFATI